MPNEEFEKWAKQEGIDAFPDLINRLSAWKGFRGRQPEIDALKAEVEKLHNKLIDAILTRQARDAELLKLKETK